MVLNGTQKTRIHNSQTKFFSNLLKEKLNRLQIQFIAYQPATHKMDSLTTPATMPSPTQFYHPFSRIMNYPMEFTYLPPHMLYPRVPAPKPEGDFGVLTASPDGREDPNPCILGPNGKRCNSCQAQHESMTSISAPASDQQLQRRKLEGPPFWPKPEPGLVPPSPLSYLTALGAQRRTNTPMACQGCIRQRVRVIIAAAVTIRVLIRENCSSVAFATLQSAVAAAAGKIPPSACTPQESVQSPTAAVRRSMSSWY
jgi:hypothetical protein